MKVLLLTPYFSPHRGGSEIFLENLGRRLFQEDAQWTMDVLTYNTEKVAAQDDFIDEASGKKIGTIYRLKNWEILRSQWALPNYWQLLGVLEQWEKEGRQYDLIISNTRFFDNSQWAPKWAKKLGAKVVLVDFCAAHPNHRLSVVTKTAAIADTILAQNIKDKYDAAIATSLATQKFMRELGMTPNEEVIYNGVDEKFFDREKAEKEKEKIVVTFAGRLIENKHPEIFLQAAIKLAEKFPQVEWRLAGNGPLLDELEKMWATAAETRREKIKILGPLSRSAMAKLLWQSHILVHPSTHSEGMPTILMEAAYCGTALVATDVGDSKEIVKTGETGTLLKTIQVIELEKVLRHYLENPTIIEEQGERAQQLAKEKFTLKTQIGKFKNLIKQLN